MGAQAASSGLNGGTAASSSTAGSFGKGFTGAAPSGSSSAAFGKGSPESFSGASKGMPTGMSTRDEGSTGSAAAAATSPDRIAKGGNTQSQDNATFSTNSPSFGPSHSTSAVPSGFKGATGSF